MIYENYPKEGPSLEKLHYLNRAETSSSENFRNGQINKNFTITEDDILSRDDFHSTSTFQSSCLASFNLDNDVEFDFDQNVLIHLGILEVKLNEKNVRYINCSHREHFSKYKDSDVFKNVYNPHDEFLAKRFNRERIEKVLEFLCPSDESRIDIEHIVSEVNPNNVEHSTIISGFSTMILPSVEQSSKDKNNSKRGRDCSDDGKKEKSFHILKHSIHTENMHEPSKKRERTRLNDELSMNHPLAVKSFISAPRLCNSTANIPSVVKMKIANEKIKNKKIISTSGKTRTKNPLKRLHSAKNSTIYSQDRTEYLYDFESQSDFETHCISKTGTRWSQSSPIGVDQYYTDSKRPWRKHYLGQKNILHPETFKTRYVDESEDELIMQLKSRIKRMISDYDVYQNDELCLSQFSIRNEASQTSKLDDIKYRRRKIEAVHSIQDDKALENHLPGLSIKDLKNRLRQIEFSKQHIMS